MPNNQGREIARLSTASSDELVPFIGSICREHAVNEGLPTSEVDDCETEFIARMILRSDVRLRSMLAVGCSAWVHVCARNFARGYRRRVTTPAEDRPSAGLADCAK